MNPQSPVWVPVRGDSMRPFLQPGDDVRLAWDTQVPPHAGEIVVFRGEDGEWVLHRVIDGGCRTKGDAAWNEDSPADRAPWARVVAVRRGGQGGQALSFSAGRLDRWIARLSGLELELGGLPRRAVRDMVHALGACRRRLVALRPS